MSDQYPNVLGSYVHLLDDDMLARFLLDDRGMLLVAFYHPLSPRWKRFCPVFEKIAKEMSSNPEVEFASIDYTGVPGRTQKFSITTFPTIMLMQGPYKVTTYSGPLREKDIISYMTRKSMPPVSTVTVDSFEEFRTANDVVVVGYFHQNDTLSRSAFHSVAEALNSDFVFGISNDDILAEAERVESPQIVVYKTFDRKTTASNSTRDEQAVKAFVKDAGRPLVVEFLPELHDGFLQGGIPLAYLFISTEKESDEVSTMVKPLAKEYKGKIQFGVVDIAVFDSLADDLHLTSNRTPAFALREPKKNLRYPLNDLKSSLNQGAIAAFVSSFLSGDLQSTIKSALIPETSQGHIVEVVAVNYEAIVYDPTKDVLIEYYTPWCGPCRLLLPDYEELASKYACDGRVTIAKMDVEANDVPNEYEIRGFPTFKLFPAAAKSVPIFYGGERTVQAWAEFIRDRGTYKVDI